MSNPLEIAAGTLLPRSLILPAGFVPNQPLQDEEGVRWPAGKPLPREIVIPRATTFPFPFLVPNGLPLSDKWSPTAEGQSNGTLYIIPNFWDGDHSVRCQYPCTILFPPATKITTWTPPPFTFSTTGWTTTVTPPVITTALIRISKLTVTSDPGSPATKVVAPVPGPKPLCIPIYIIITTIYICPPALFPFPPPLPMVTIGPLPPGGRSHPVNEPNKPTPEQEQVGVLTLCPQNIVC